MHELLRARLRKITMNTPKPSDIFRRSPELRANGSTVDAVLTGEHATATLREVGVSETVGDETGLAACAVDQEFGNPELPIAQYRDRIIESVAASQATIITAETGAGKSTQVPQFLAEAGYEVIVTQPRVVAARSVAERVREEVVSKRGAHFKDFVGYRTARERGDSPDNQILFATDGLQLVRELSGHGVGKKQALVLDEVHEWNENMEVLVAWAKQRMDEDPDFKVVVMSATMEADPLSRYFSGDARRVPIIEVPGRTYEVKKEEGGDVADQAIRMAREGKNTLVFVPGKAEIDQVMAEISRANISGATILPLHGQLEAAEQRKVFAKYPGVKIIVATNVAQTSVTIEDIDAVVDSGLERTNEVRNGVEGLYLKPISQADCLQRAGRAGRTKEGEYVLAQLGNNRFVSFDEREPYGTPEILRTRLDGMVLRLAKNGIDAAEMDFYHSKDEHGRDIKPEIAAAKERLQKLGALRQDDSITKIGRDMERMPVESHYARMMIEARRYDPELQMQLAAVLAVQEAGGILQFDSRNKPCIERWRSVLRPGMNDSDMIKQLEVFIAARSMSDRERRDSDIFVKAVSKANEVLRQLRSVEKLHDQELVVPTHMQREQLVKCIISGMVDNLYINEGYYGYRDARGNVRELSARSMIVPSKMVVGRLFDLQVNTRRGTTTLNLLESPTNIPSVDLLREVAPQLFSEVSRGLTVGVDGVVYERFAQVFNGHDMGEEALKPAIESPERTACLARAAAKEYWNMPETRRIIEAVEDLNQRCPGTVELMTLEQLCRATSEVMPRHMANVEDALEYVPHFSLDDLISSQRRAEVLDASPDKFNGRLLTYLNGQPLLGGSLTEDEVLGLVADDLVLPDGRRIGCRDSWGYIDIRTYQQQITKARVRRAELEQQEQQRRIGDALHYFNSGYERVDVERWFGESVAEAAWGQYSDERGRREREDAEAIVRRSNILAHTVELLDLNDSLYERARVERFEDAPTDIKDEAISIRDQLDGVKRELVGVRQYLEAGREVSVDSYTHTMSRIQEQFEELIARYEEWNEKQRQLEDQPVSDTALAALAARFNNR